MSVLVAATDVARQIAEGGAVDLGPAHDWKPAYWFIGMFSDQTPSLIERCERCKVYRDVTHPDYSSDLISLDVKGGLVGTYVQNGYQFYEYTEHCSTTKPEAEVDDI